MPRPTRSAGSGSARVTFIAADGAVVGDSEVSSTALPSVENHGDRPEVRAALADGLGIAQPLQRDGRHRHALRRGAGRATRRVAGLARRPPRAAADRSRASSSPSCAASRSAACWSGMVARPGAGLDHLRAAGTPHARDRVPRRERYAAGDLTGRARDPRQRRDRHRRARARRTVRELGRRTAELAADRARMEAILGGMIEGVLVVNEHGRLQLVNAAARRMLQARRRAGGAPLPRDRAPSRHRGADRLRARTATPPRAAS